MRLRLFDSPALLASVLMLAVPAAGQRQPRPAPAPALEPPAELTSQQDHKRMLDLLGIASLRPGPSGNPQAPNAANLDESKANPYPTLPEPLVFKNGRKVSTPEQWAKRRLEILEDFDREVYGRTPKQTPKVTWIVTTVQAESVGDVPVVKKTLVGRVDNSSYPLVEVNIQLTLTTPARTAGRVPVMLNFGFGPLPPGFPPRPSAPGPTWQEQVLAKGWGYAVLAPTSVQPDNGAGLTRGIIGLVNKGRPRALEDWGALKAWAWGASRALDYLETDPVVDGRQVGLEGLSRYGKAVVVAMAYDPRFAIAFVGSSGAAGVKLHRRHYGEQVENVAGSGEYHWMGGNYLKYAGPLTPNDLPVDSHELVALCAPRPVFVSVGSLAVEGGWIDAKGHVHGGCGGRSGVPAPRKEGHGDQRVPADGDAARRRRHRLPSAHWRSYHRPELADVPRVRQPLPDRARREVGQLTAGLVERLTEIATLNAAAGEQSQP